MKTIVMFETASELLDAASMIRGESDPRPTLPDSVYLVVRGESREPELSLSGDGSENFEIAGSINYDDLVAAMALRCGFTKVHFT